MKSQTPYDFLTLYATQTNTAKNASEEIGREALRRGLATRILPFDDYNIFNLPTEKLVVFVIATTGDGDPPATMVNAWKFLLRKDLPPGSLANLKFTCFGLGDSSYEKFNAMAKKLTQRLLDLGAQLFHKVGLGDYQHDFEYEGEFDPWMKMLWGQLQSVIPHKVFPSEISESDADKLLPPIYKVEVLDITSPSNTSTLHLLNKPIGAFNQQVILTKVLQNKRITAEDHF
jgi:sulfite reductase alpha subunit-like flavoprotein